MLKVIIILISENPFRYLDFCHIYINSDHRDNDNEDNNSESGEQDNEHMENTKNQSNRNECTGGGSTPGSNDSDKFQSEEANVGGETSSTQSGETSGSQNEESREFSTYRLSVDYSQVHIGRIWILVNGKKFIALNLAWLFGAMSRSSRKKLAKWLEQKEVEGGFPLEPQNAQTAIADPAPSSTTTAAGASEGKENSKSSEASKSAILTIKRIHKLLGIDLSIHSNAVMDQLRVWFNRNQVTLFRYDSTGKKFVRFNLEEVVQKIVAQVKANRSEKKSKSKSASGK